MKLTKQWLEENVPDYESCTEYTVQSGVTSIDAHAFEGFAALQKVVIPDDVVSIGDDAFHDCKNLREAVLPENLADLGAACFQSTAIESIEIPDRLEKIQFACFAQCRDLKHVKLGKNILEIEAAAFYDSGVSSLEFNDNCFMIGDTAFKRCSKLERVDFPARLGMIKASAFQNAALKSIVLPRRVFSIDEEAFSGCLDLSDVAFADGNINPSVTVLPNAFSHCKSLKSFAFLSDNDVTLFDNSFSSCTSLQHVSIKARAVIHKNAFYGCTSLEQISVVPGSEICGSNVFKPFSTSKLTGLSDSIVKVNVQHTEASLSKLKRFKHNGGEKPKTTQKQNVLLAPNGKPSKLTKRQWYAVRSKPFKAWFGDWEKDPEHSSKMLDENGEPMVFFHGSSTWNPFAPAKQVLEYMTHAIPPDFDTGNGFVDIFGRKQKLTENDLGVTDAMLDAFGIKADQFKDFQRECKSFADDVIFMFDRNDAANAQSYAKWTSHGSRFAGSKLGKEDFAGSVLQLFVNARKVLVLDFAGRSYYDFDIASGTTSAEAKEAWNQICEYLDIAMDKTASKMSSKNPKTHTAGISRILKDIRDHGAETIDKFVGDQRAKLKRIVDALHDYDCVKCVNCKDMGEHDIQTQYIVLDPINVKSATKNSGEFSSSDPAIMAESLLDAGDIGSKGALQASQLVDPSQEFSEEISKLDSLMKAGRCIDIDAEFGSTPAYQAWKNYVKSMLGSIPDEPGGKRFSGYRRSDIGHKHFKQSRGFIGWLTQLKTGKIHVPGMLSRFKILGYRDGDSYIFGHWISGGMLTLGHGLFIPCYIAASSPAQTLKTVKNLCMYSNVAFYVTLDIADVLRKTGLYSDGIVHNAEYAAHPVQKQAFGTSKTALKALLACLKLA